MQPEADKVRAAYVEERAEELVKRTGMSKADAVKAAESQCAGVLASTSCWSSATRSSRAAPSATCCLIRSASSVRHWRTRLKGPGYKSGRTTAMIMLRRDNGYPWIKSFAHGGERSFTLVRKPGDELKLDFPGRIPECKKKTGDIVSLMSRANDATAISSSTSTHVVVVPDWRERNQYGDPVPSMHNARLAIKALGVVCSYDTFHNKMLFGYREDAAPPDMVSVMLGEVTDNGIIRLRKIMSDISASI